MSFEGYREPLASGQFAAPADTDPSNGAEPLPAASRTRDSEDVVGHYGVADQTSRLGGQLFAAAPLATAEAVACEASRRSVVDLRKLDPPSHG